MSVAPLPAYRIFHLHVDTSRVKFGSEIPTLEELGRHHFTKDELKAINKRTKGHNDMAFKAIDTTTLPIAARGKVAATSPKFGISASGQIMPNGFVGKLWEGVERVVIAVDVEARKLGLIGLTADAKAPKGFEKSIFKLAKGKDGKGSGSIAASGLLKVEFPYSYKENGNQIFDAEFNTKSNMYIITVPEKMTPKPTVARKPRTAATPVVGSVAASKANGQLPLVAEATDDELLLS